MMLIAELPKRINGNHKAGLFKCDCGKEFEAEITRVKNGYRKHCGCKKSENMSKARSEHGMSYSREYHIWQSMKARCHRLSHHAYKNYGGRGIAVCDRWRNSFQNFIDDMGKLPTQNHTIDRIDNDGNYTPENCRWATMAVQERNRRNTLFVDTPKGRMRLTEYAELLGQTYSATYMMLYRRKLPGVVKI